MLSGLLEAADEAPHEVLDCGISLIANCFRTAFPFPESNKVAPFILPLGKLLSHSHPVVVEKSCWALDYIAYGPYNRIAAFCTTHEDSICRKLVSLLSHADQKVVNAALATLGAISHGSISQTQAILGSGALQKFKDLLEHVDKKIVMRTLLAVSNIAGDGREHIKVRECSFSSSSHGQFSSTLPYFDNRIKQVAERSFVVNGQNMFFSQISIVNFNNFSI
ncbi:uncharacterized protein [Diadema antillarum]|uniref:uncharacterized protein n=1 Tax=Diadema antillarum TaxID=105358 RepID=UPI003A84D732